MGSILVNRAKVLDYWISATRFTFLLLISMIWFELSINCLYWIQVIFFFKYETTTSLSVYSAISVILLISAFLTMVACDITQSEVPYIKLIYYINAFYINKVVEGMILSITFSWEHHSVICQPRYG